MTLVRGRIGVGRTWKLVTVEEFLCEVNKV